VGGYLRRFSVVATVCVGVMILTGLWTYWLHVGPPRLLVHTLYGETLLVKLGLVLALLGLGAVNQLWLLPRVQALRAAGAGDWRASVRAGSGPAATFAFAVAAEPQDPAKAAPPPIEASTWIWGAGWVLVVVLALAGAGIASRRLARHHDPDGARSQDALAVAGG
jgi:hypothetical protein